MQKNRILTFFLLSISCFITIKSITFPYLKYHKSQETLDTIMEIISKKEKGVFLRFGDGDVNLLTNKNEMLQSASHQLTQEMREAFALNGPTILKALPLTCEEFGGYEPGMTPGNHMFKFQESTNILNAAKPFWNGPIKDVYCWVALHYVSTNNIDYCIKFLRFLKNSGCSILVGNKDIPKEIRELLFGPNCYFVPTPAQQSYREIDRIEKECLEKTSKTNEYQIIITSMGCSGRILQKRLWKRLDNIFLFDFGSLMDALCGWETRSWMSLSQFDRVKFLKLLSEKLK